MMEKSDGSEELRSFMDGRMSDEVFEDELSGLMEEDCSGKKKRKKKGFPWKHWSRKRRIVTGAVAAAAVILVLSIRSMGGGGAKGPMVMTAPVIRGDIKETLTVTGPVQGTDSVEVVSNLHAEILEIPLKEGDRVERDQLLAALDPTDIQREVDQAQNAYDLAVSTYDRQAVEAVNGYAKAIQDYETAKLDYDRISALHQVGSISQQELEKARNALNDASRAIDTFTVVNGKAVPDDTYRLQIENARLDLEEKRSKLENTQIKSPITGTLVRVNTKVGRFADTIDDDKPIFIIDNLDQLEMKIKVSEYSIGKVKVGQPVTIRADLLNGDTIPGEVTAISPTGEEKGGGSTERVIPITIRIDDKESRLIAGITAKAEILLAESEDTLIVPASALIQKEDGAYVAAVENSKLKLIPVELGVESDVQTEVRARAGAEGSEPETEQAGAEGSEPETEQAGAEDEKQTAAASTAGESAVLAEGVQVVINPTPDFEDGMTVITLPAQ